MKRIISAFLATAVCTAAMSIVLTACSSKTADSSTTTPESTSTSTVTETAEDAADNTQIPNPITDRASLDEVNEAIGSAMKRPADLELTDEAWVTIDDEEKNPIGQYTFAYNGGTYTLRAAKEMDYKRVWAVFQPFTYTRTQMLLDDFARGVGEWHDLRQRPRGRCDRHHHRKRWPLVPLV